MKDLKLGQTLYITKEALTQGIKTGIVTEAMPGLDILFIPGSSNVHVDEDCYATYGEAVNRVNLMRLEAIAKLRAEIETLNTAAFYDRITTVTPLEVEE